MGELEATKDCVAISQETTDLAKENTTLNFFEKPCYERVKEVIRAVQNEVLEGKTYSPENAKKWSVEIGNEVSKRLRDLNMRRYKHITEVILAELTGAGMRTVIKCFWDSDTDSYTKEEFSNDSIMCVTLVFTILLY